MRKDSFWAIVPLFIFVLTFVGSGIYYNDFYALPSPVAIIISIIVAFIIYRQPYKEKIHVFLEGCGNRNILSMCIIYLLAGAFAMVSKAIGSVDVIVHFGIMYIDVQYVPAGVFVLAAFISLASGTSVGTIVALGPIVLGFVEKTNLDVNLLGAALLGGSMFGDNLSMISDTTIAATQSQGATMQDKFRANFRIALPAALLTAILYIIFSKASGILPSGTSLSPYSLLLALPYILVIVLSLLGIDVFIVLLLGITISGGLGFMLSDLSFLEFGKKIYEGFSSMQEIFILSLFTGGLTALVEKAGGMSYILSKTNSFVRGKKTAMMSIAGLVSLTNLSTANNTVAIITTGKIAKSISTEYNIPPKISASILDTFSCIVQGLLPYGAQILILISLSDGKISYPSLLLYSLYPLLLLVSVLVSISFRK